MWLLYQCQNGGHSDADTFVSRTDVQAQFLKASALVGDEFIGRLDYYTDAWLPARDLVLAGIKARTEIDPSGKVILVERFAPWKVRARLPCALIALVFVASRTSNHLGATIQC